MHLALNVLSACALVSLPLHGLLRILRCTFARHVLSCIFLCMGSCASCAARALDMCSRASRSCVSCRARRLMILQEEPFAMLSGIMSPDPPSSQKKANTSLKVGPPYPRSHKYPSDTNANHLFWLRCKLLTQDNMYLELNTCHSKATIPSFQFSQYAIGLFEDLVVFGSTGLLARLGTGAAGSPEAPARRGRSLEDAPARACPRCATPSSLALVFPPKSLHVRFTHSVVGLLWYAQVYESNIFGIGFEARCSFHLGLKGHQEE